MDERQIGPLAEASLIEKQDRLMFGRSATSTILDNTGRMEIGR